MAIKTCTEGGEVQLAAFNYAPDPLIIVSASGTILFANRATETALLYSPQDLIGRTFASLVSPSDSGRYWQMLADLFAATRHSTPAASVGNLYCHRKDQIDVPFRLSVSRVRDEREAELVVSLIDQSDRTLDDDPRHQMMGLVESADDAILTKTLDGTIRSWNPAAERLLGYRPEEIIGKPVLLLIPELRRDEERMIIEKICRGQRVAHFETVRRRRDGSEVEVSLTISPIRDRAGSIIGASKIMRDITEQKRTVALLEALNSELNERMLERTAELKERESLLQEIHHRVKNNLQVISSLINMQARSLQDLNAKAMLRQCQLRVQTMAQIHEILYQSKSYSRVPFARYAKDLANHVLQAMESAPAAVTLRFTLEDIELPVEQAIPAGLILNELVANCLRHAFPQCRQGNIAIGLARHDANRIMLVVGDDGVGIGCGSTLERTDSLGAHLVRTLARQLEGEVTWSANQGTEVRLIFPMEIAS